MPRCHKFLQQQFSLRRRNVRSLSDGNAKIFGVVSCRHMPVKRNKQGVYTSVFLVSLSSNCQALLCTLHSKTKHFTSRRRRNISTNTLWLVLHGCHDNETKQNELGNKLRVKVKIEIYEVTAHSWALVFTAQCTSVQSAVLRSHVICLSVRLSVCDVGDLWSHRLEILETNCTGY